MSLFFIVIFSKLSAKLQNFVRILAGMWANRIKNLKLHGGTYPFMFSNDIYVDGLESDSKYVFQYVKNVEIHNAKITTKDAFWEVENVTIYDSELNGEYLGWHSRNLRLVNSFG